MIVKTSPLTRVSPIYRGVMGGTLPEWFWSHSAHGVHGCVDAAFTSASMEKAIATDSSSITTSGKAPVLLEIHQGLRDRGAMLEWVSQWPHEKEVALPPMSGLEV